AETDLVCHIEKRTSLLRYNQDRARAGLSLETPSPPLLRFPSGGSNEKDKQPPHCMCFSTLVE
ncbi:MAG: hypothetical protein WHZ52_09025, partial [Armatimonadota bacterium]